VTRAARFRVFGVLVLVQFFFGSLPVAVKFALVDLSPPALALLRVASAALLFLALQRTLPIERIRRADYGRFAVYALFGVVVNQLLYISALSFTTATSAQTIMVVGPAMTLLVAILLRREASTGQKWLGIALAGAGVLYLVGTDLTSGHGIGNLMVLLNAASFSIYLVISRDALLRYSPLTVITWVFVFGTIGIAPWGMVSLWREAAGMSGTTLAAMAWIVLVPTVLGYYLNLWALKRVESSVVAIFVYLQPVVTASLALPLLGERISPRLLPAAALIFAGVWVSSRVGKQRRGIAPAGGV
jgi:drug/metabolite transporter (DMT)-like permease